MSCPSGVSCPALASGRRMADNDSSARSHPDVRYRIEDRNRPPPLLIASIPAGLQLRVKVGTFGLAV